MWHMKTVVIPVVVGALAWYSEEEYGTKHQESIRENYYDRNSKDLHAGIRANPQKGAQCMNRMIDLSDCRL